MAYTSYMMKFGAVTATAPFGEQVFGGLLLDIQQYISEAKKGWWLEQAVRARRFHIGWLFAPVNFSRDNALRPPTQNNDHGTAYPALVFHCVDVDGWQRYSDTWIVICLKILVQRGPWWYVHYERLHVWTFDGENLGQCPCPTAC